MEIIYYIFDTMLSYTVNTFHCVLTNNALLPAYKGSTFRGAFGVALKKVSCAVRNKVCADCLLSARCIYALIFEPTSWQHNLSRTATPTHPYIIEPDTSHQTHYSIGALFCFNVVLFGDHIHSIPYFIYAVQIMGETGIGSKKGGGRAQFTLREVTGADGSQIYGSASNRTFPSSQTLTLKTPQVNSVQTGKLSVSLKTPLRLKSDNKLTDKLPFQEFIRACLRQVAAFHTAYGDGDPPLDYRSIVADAAVVKSIESSLHWHDWKRYSNRQQHAMLFGGLLGNISFVGKIGQLMQIIDQARVTHIGKQVTFGLGQFSYVWEPESE